MSKYSETHHLNVDENGQASVHVAVHLQDADPRIARLLVLRVLDAASTIADPDPVILPQTSGPCVHCTCYGEGWVGRIDEMPSMELVTKINDIRGRFPELNLPGSEKTITMTRPELISHLKRVAGTDAVASCTYPYDDLTCPHLDNPDILYPIKDDLYGMREVARMREACEVEQEEQDHAIEGDDVPRSEYVLSPRPEPEPAESPAPTAPGDDQPPEDVPIPLDADEPLQPPDGAQEGHDGPTEGPAGVSEGMEENGPSEEDRPLEPAEAIVFQDGMRWTDPEKAIIASAEDPADAIRRYREAFPKSTRGDSSIKTRWYMVRRKPPARSIHDLVGMRVEVRLRSSPHFGRIGRVTLVNEAACELRVQFDDDPTVYWVGPEGVAAVEEGS